MAVRKTNKGTTSVSHKGALVATPEIAQAIAQVSNMRATKKQCTSKEDLAKVEILKAVGDRARIILNDEGDVICEVISVETSKTTIDDFVDAMAILYPEVWASLMDVDPRAVDAAKNLATKKDRHLRINPK
jgi:hypothetical protein